MSTSDLCAVRYMHDLVKDPVDLRPAMHLILEKVVCSNHLTFVTDIPLEYGPREHSMSDQRVLGNTTRKLIQGMGMTFFRANEGDCLILEADLRRVECCSEDGIVGSKQDQYEAGDRGTDLLCLAAPS